MEKSHSVRTKSAFTPFFYFNSTQILGANLWTKHLLEHLHMISKNYLILLS